MKIQLQGLWAPKILLLSLVSIQGSSCTSLQVQRGVLRLVMKRWQCHNLAASVWDFWEATSHLFRCRGSIGTKKACKMWENVTSSTQNQLPDSPWFSAAFFGSRFHPEALWVPWPRGKWGVEKRWKKPGKPRKLKGFAHMFCRSVTLVGQGHIPHINSDTIFERLAKDTIIQAELAMVIGQIQGPTIGWNRINRRDVIRSQFHCHQGVFEPRAGETLEIWQTSFESTCCGLKHSNPAVAQWHEKINEFAMQRAVIQLQDLKVG